MSERWVMAERKLIDGKMFAVGDDAPAGHEGRPYTLKVEDTEPAQRIVEDAPNRMLDTAGAKKRGRPRKVQP